MSHRIAGIDVHKKMLAVVVDIEVQGEYQFEQRQFSSNPEHLRWLAEWLIEQQVEEVVMESTAQYRETSLGSTGTVLETTLPDVGNAPSGASTIELPVNDAQRNGASTHCQRCSTTVTDAS